MIDTPNIDSIKNFLEIMRRLRSGIPVTGYYYRGQEDFILQHGQGFAPRKPKGYRWRKARNCFGNTHKLVMYDPTLRYVEGYGLTGLGIPLEHAWAIDEDNQVIDTTWRWNDGSPPEGYFGVIYPTQLVNQIILRKKCYGVLDDPYNRYPLLREPYDPVSALERIKKLEFKS